MCTCVFVCDGHTCMSRPEDNLQESVLSFHYVNFRDQTLGLISWHLSLLSHLTSSPFNDKITPYLPACFFNRVFYLNDISSLCYTELIPSFPIVASYLSFFPSLHYLDPPVQFLIEMVILYKCIK